MVFYIEATAESIVSILTTGRRPKQPSGSISDSTFNLCKCPSEFVLHSTSADQIFILHLELEKYVATNFINQEYIRCVYVYSQNGLDFLNKLFNNACPKPIIILPEIYPAHLLTPAVQQLTFSKLSQKLIDRVDNVTQHITLLQNAFKHAKKSILITSYGINHETMLRTGLYNLISKTPSNVTIYIYNNHDKPIDVKILEFFYSHRVKFDYTDTHSKVLAVDEAYIVAGSFNWLSAINSEHEYNANSSFVVYSGAVKLLIKDLWKHIRHYRNYQFGNIKAWREFEKNQSNHETAQYAIGADSSLLYLATLEQHIKFIDECFATAKKRIIIISPFISTNSADDFTSENLLSVIARGVDIYFVCLQDQIVETEFDDYLSGINSSRIHLVPMNNIHLKTFIVDSDTIAEGSFNWLSAARDANDDYHNHEVTLVTKGAAAKEFIEQFEQSNLGVDILSISNKPKIKRQYLSLKE